VVLLEILKCISLHLILIFILILLICANCKLFVPFYMHEIYVSYSQTLYSFNIRHAAITLVRLSALKYIFLFCKVSRHILEII